ncbi:type VII secretion integral membrane protein EccD [Mycolicibacterium sp. HK-90]|uniref:type VII secretion integral membrane protein EccD n=1 Tax=Mycolicibacterium sp. HK-90 TaxID=3056937 RepID=UPI00265AFED2|nr:type VII secretion integral membrane protein EccD [Mycolicibacterium sp. HK-90]WKG04862.1 type VII secretion integral membrane protein EccD [Mycolicibacterium sp. HK-90]
MPDSLRHVSIHCGSPDEAGHGATVDLSLPAALTVGEMLPWIVDALDVGDGTSRRWHLTHLGGQILDESTTLAQNDIRDGDLLVLTAASEHPGPDRPLVAVPAAEPPDGSLPMALRVAGCLWTCALGIVALTWAGLGNHGWGRIAATAVAAVVVTAVAVGAEPLRLDSAAVSVLNIAAVAHVAVLGFLVVPAGPAPANVFLAAVAAASLGAVLVRVSGDDTEILVAVTTAAGLVAVAAGGAALWPVSTPASGAVLSALGLGLLALTPRLSIALAGLTPAVPGYPGAEEDELGGNDFGTEATLRRGHRNLVGLILGCSTAIALGIAALTLTGLGRVTGAEVAFTAAVGVALLLRSRTYASGRCRTGPAVAGFLALTATFVLVVAWAPGQGSWTGILAVGTGIALLWPVTVQSPVAARIADALEYAALAAVVPLACWLTGAFDLVLGLGPK